MKTKKLIFLCTVILSFTCLTSNSFGFSESDLQKLKSDKICVNCDLSRAFLVDKDLSEANLTEANLTGAKLQGANLRGANLTEANLTGANLHKADLSNANLTGANLTAAFLGDADLTGADLSNANLTGANPEEAFLDGANLKGTIGIEKRLAGFLEEQRLAEVEKLAIAIAEASQNITPERQKEFLDIISTYAEKYKNSTHEMKKSFQRKKRIKAFKEFFSDDLGFMHWVGTIKSFDTDKDGDAYVFIDIGGVTLNNAREKIKFSDDLFDKVAEMEIGDKVLISGSFLNHEGAREFLKDTIGGDLLITTGWYLDTLNPTEKGGMTVPRFSVGYDVVVKVKTETVEQVASKCSAETDSLQRLTCYDNLPENLKSEQCSSISDSLKRLSCFDNQKS